MEKKLLLYKECCVLSLKKKDSYVFNPMHSLRAQPLMH